MAAIKKPAPVALFAAILYSPSISDRAARTIIVENFGRVLCETPPFAFDFSSYYEKEMGANLRKAFFLMDRLIDAAALPDWKLRAIEIEERFSKEGKRTVNLDPGYLAMPKLVLSTNKNFSHRIYLRDGVYGDVQLYVQNGTFQANPWTYPDYKRPDHLKFFEQARARYIEKLKSIDEL